MLVFDPANAAGPLGWYLVFYALFAVYPFLFRRQFAQGVQMGQIDTVQSKGLARPTPGLITPDCTEIAAVFSLQHQLHCHIHRIAAHRRLPQRQIAVDAIVTDTGKAVARIGHGRPLLLA